MKRILFLFSVLIFVSSSYAQSSYGSYTEFYDKKYQNSKYKPQLAFGKVNNQYLLVLCYCAPNEYASFNEESVMLLKFEDDSTVILPISKSDKVSKNLDKSWNFGTKQFIYYYQTYTSFDLTQEVVDRIVKDGQKIKKIRVLFTNGNIQDWDIVSRSQSKLVKGLIASYNKVESKDAKRKENINNIENGF